jgi:hypothetical protein
VVKVKNKKCKIKKNIFAVLAVIFLLYKCPVAKLGSKAGNFLSGKRGRERVPRAFEIF